MSVPVSSLLMSQRVIALCFMDTDRAAFDDLTILRSAFEAGTPLGWEPVHAFEKQQGIVLPEPYRTFVAEITDGPVAGPPFCGMVKLGSLPKDWGDGRPERDLTKPFPLTEAWVWEDDLRSCEELGTLLEPVYGHGSLVLGTDGCGMYWHLIVTGPHRGHVWLITGEGAQPFGAKFGYTSARSGFGGWVPALGRGQGLVRRDADNAREIVRDEKSHRNPPVGSRPESLRPAPRGVTDV